MTDAVQISTISKVTTFVKTHLVIWGVVAIMAAGPVYEVESIVARHDAAQQTRDQQLLGVMTAQTTDLKTRMAQDEQAAIDRDKQYTTIIAQLSGTITRQNVQLQQQIKQNSTLTAQQTAQAITDKLKAQPGEVTAQNDNVIVDLPISHQINSSLDILATTTLQLEETKKQLDAQTGLTTDAALELDNAKKVIAAQDTQAVTAGKVCTDQINTIKAQARKGKMKWFFIGVLTGLGLAHPLGI